MNRRPHSSRRAVAACAFVLIVLAAPMWPAPNGAIARAARSGATTAVTPTATVMATVPLSTTLTVMATGTVTATPMAVSPAATPTATVPVATAVITVSPAVVSPGKTLTISGNSFSPGESVDISLGFQHAATAQATASGSLAPLAITVPQTITTGLQIVLARGATSGRIAEANVSIRAGTMASISLDATAYDPNRPACVRGRGFGPLEIVVVRVNGLYETTGLADADGAFVICYQTPSTIGIGRNTVTVTGLATKAQASASFQGVSPVVRSYYFAGGSTLVGENTELAILNAGQLRAHVALTLYTRYGAPRHRAFAVSAHTRATVYLAALVGSGNEVGVRLDSDQVLTAQLVVHRKGKSPYVLSSASAPGFSWYLAAGNTSGTFHELLHVLNAGRSNAILIVQGFPAGGGRSRTLFYTVPAQRVATFELNRLIPNREIGVIVRSFGPVVVSRVMTFGRLAYGANASTGVAGVSTVWHFTYGLADRGVYTALDVLNPNTKQQAALSISLSDASGRVLLSHHEQVGPQERATVPLGTLFPLTHFGAFQISVTSTSPIVIEREIYYGNPNTDKAASSVVSEPSRAAYSWSFATGDTQAGSHEMLLVSNPNTLALTVRATIYFGNGATRSLDISVPGLGRTTIGIDRALGVPASVHGIRLVAQGLLPFVAEQAIYTTGFRAGYATLGAAQ